MTLSRSGSRRTGPAAALAELRQIAVQADTPLDSVEKVEQADGQLLVRLRLNTSNITVVPTGLPVSSDHEDVLISIPRLFPLSPPTFRVDHERFVGHPHVLQGDRLCIYLDPTQEWHYIQGVVGFLDRLWRWFEDAAAARFDQRTALFHPVGGILHASRGTPTVVVRTELEPGNRPFTRRWLRPRSLNRFDLVNREEACGGAEAAVVTLPGPLRYGAGTSVLELCAALFRAGHPRPLPAFGVLSPPRDTRYPPALDVLAVLAQVAARNPPSTPLYVVLAVPGSDSQNDLHLICGRIPTAATARLRQAAIEQGPLLRLAKEDIPFDAPVEWCTVSEERPSVTTRRDSHRPVAAYVGTYVVLCGCGGLGSWIGEFLARAGVARLTLCDPANIAGGLLVRQDFTELDVGSNKAEALKRRVEAIRDGLEVDVATDISALIVDGGLPACDLFVDATVSNTVGALLTLLWPVTQSRPVVARVSIDRATSTLGLLTVTAPDTGPNPEEADRQTGEAVAANGSLELYRCFWDPVDPAEEITPAPGCSLPTFHGSAADLAAISGILVSLLGPHLSARHLAGSHLVGLPHGPATGRHWIAVS